MNCMTFFRLIPTILALTTLSFGQIKVLESTQSVVRLQWEIAGIDTILLKNSVQQSVALSFKGQNTVVGAPGDAALPGYSLFTGIAPRGEVSVTVVAEQVLSMQLPASPVVEQQNNKAISQKQPEFISPWISQPVYEQIRGIRTAAMIIRPGVYDKDSRMLKVMTRGTITIQLPPGVRHTTASGKSEFETMTSRLLCNYPVAKGWRQSASGLKKKKSSDVFPLDNRKVYHFKVGDGFNDFNEGTTFENGLMKIPGKVINDVFGILPVSNVILYASVKGELPIDVPEIGNLPDGVVEIPLLRVDINSNGMVDPEDYFLTYVTGASDWGFDFNESNYKMNIDRYDDYRNYWLTTGNNGASVKRYENSSTPDTIVHHFVQPTFWIKNLELSSVCEGGLDWIWYRLTNTVKTFSQPLTLPGIDTSFPGRIKMNFHTSMGSLFMSFGSVRDSGITSVTDYDINSWGDQKIGCLFDPYGDNPWCEIRSAMVHYSRKMEIPKSEALTIFSNADTGNFAYEISGLDNGLAYIFRIGPKDQIELIDTVRNRAGGGYSWVDSGRTGVRYIVCREQNLLPFPENVEYRVEPGVAHSVRDLRNTSNETGYLIITHHDFIAQAESLAVHKEKMGFLKPAVVDVADIYRLFSGGDLDPTAIRNFLIYVKNRSWKAGADLDFVVLFGSGHYNVKLRGNVLKPSFIPPYYQNNELLIEDYFTVTEPYSVYAFPSCAIGRITCETVKEAAVVVKKIREYEDPSLADYSAWRNRALFVADDDMQGEKEDPIISMTPHHVSSDVASDALNAKWGSLDLRKVFLYEYEWDSSKRKPGATRAIINQINNGVGFVNYFGHGAYYIWADEEAMNLSDLGKLYNRGQYPIVSSFSCSVGKFDQPGSECFSSAFLKTENAGAIATISSARASYANYNERFAVNFYSQIIDSTRQVRSIGTMFTKAKIDLMVESNRSYVLMGDPSISIVQAVKNIDIRISDSKDSSISEIKSMQLVKVSGKVLNNSGSLDNGYGSDAKPAYIQIGLFNPADSASRKDGRTVEMKYLLPGNPIFLGNTRVVNGQFEQSVLIPKKVSFNKPGVQLIAFSWKEGSVDCGSGFRKGYTFQGSEETLINDTVGPAVSIQMYQDTSDAAYSDLEKTMVFKLSIYDPSGVDIIGIDPDEGLAVEIPGVLAKRSINSNFQFREGDFKNGTALVEIPVPKVIDGKNTLVVTSRDLLGNLSVATFPVDFSKLSIDNDELEPNLDNVCNFPNPVRLGMTTRFFFYKSEVNERFIPDHYRFVVKIYTLSGKLIRVFKDAHNGLVWDCRDQRGKSLSPDVYLYQVTAYSSLTKKMVKSKIGKVVIHPPK
ncbi:MAG TPA: C25 family cysteine peptidase [Chitinispirillaceae bacterium]|nr:C25 family cysteine peptidase [Chitinispirillaceae bacterium]